MFMTYAVIMVTMVTQHLLEDGTSRTYAVMSASKNS